MTPVIDSITRSTNGTVITVSWQPITLEQARGFFQYLVTLTPVTISRRQAMMLTANVSSDQTSVTFRNVDRNTRYSVSVAAVNIRNMSLVVTATPMTVAPPQGQLQLCLCGVCFMDSPSLPFLPQHHYP